MKQWTKETAEKAIKNGEGLSRCGAMDYYKKEFGAAALNKLVGSSEKPAKKITSERRMKNEEVIDNTLEEVINVEDVFKKDEKSNNKKPFEKKERKQYAFTRSIGSEWGNVLSSFKKK